jgi:hypothetical protein
MRLMCVLLVGYSTEVPLPGGGSNEEMLQPDQLQNPSKLDLSANLLRGFFLTTRNTVSISSTYFTR